MNLKTLTDKELNYWKELCEESKRDKEGDLKKFYDEIMEEIERRKNSKQ